MQTAGRAYTFAGDLIKLIESSRRSIMVFKYSTHGCKRDILLVVWARCPLHLHIAIGEVIRRRLHKIGSPHCPALHPAGRPAVASPKVDSLED